MELSSRKSSGVRVRLTALFCLAVLGVSVLLATYAQAAAQPTLRFGQRLVTVHDRGQDRGILTTASTLRQMFEENNIRLDPNDTVEPGLDQPLVATNYDVNIYRARPVTIIDGNKRTKVMSPHQTASQIAKQAGVTLHKEDETAITANRNMVSQGAGVQLTIHRATPVQLVLYGEKTTVYTQVATVAELLEEKDIILGKDDTVSVPLATKITKNMTVEVWRNGVQTVTVEEDIAFAVREVKDADRPVGYREVQTPGEKGKRKVTYEITRKNGQEVSRAEIQSIVLSEPKEQVEVVGTKRDLPPGSHQDWMAAAGIAASDYGYVEFIISHESGWRPDAVNPAGYYGLGQTNLAAISSACPNWQTDPICQLRFFTGYATSRYGSWSGAYDFWVGHNWW